ncbi:MAG: hypothetical protein V4692_02300 [Bdellovibrionota bacterium]
METSTWVMIGAAGVFVGFIIVYLLLMIFFPEWVGITGKVALEAERSHREGAEAKDDDITTRLQQKPKSKN